jgi:DNA polymerase III delta prime subunit
MAIDLWTEKYRPKTLDDYIWRDPEQRKRAEEWIADGALPHILFSGSPGTGKTSLAELLLIMLGIPKGDILKINASRERRIDEIQDRIMNFVSTWAMPDNESGIKYVLLDEADAISPLAQKMLRGDMERYHASCRIIFTANYPNKISDAIHSRVQHLHFHTLDQEQFLLRLIGVLDREGVTFEDDVVFKIMTATYPDMRKCLNLAQQSVIANVLVAPAESDAESTADYLVELAALFKQGRTTEARKLLIAKSTTEEYVEIFRFFYRNLELWGETEEQMEDALLAIRRALVHHAVVADPEINMAALLVELSRISKQ